MSSPAPLPQLRVLGRISVGFIVDIITVARMGNEFLDTLITVAIVQANLTPLAADPGLQHAYGDYDAPPPDDLRRPVSVNAVAASLKLPYETVRRRVAALAKGPGFELTPHGVVVSGALVNSPQHREMLDANYALVRAFYQRLRGLGALQDVADLAATVTGRRSSSGTKLAGPPPSVPSSSSGRCSVLARSTARNTTPRSRSPMWVLTTSIMRRM